MNDKCLIWGTPCKKIEQVPHQHGPTWLVDSLRAGGKYLVNGIVYWGGAIAALEELSKMKLSRWIYEQNQLGEIPEIYRDTLEKKITRPMPSVAERMDYCLQFLASKTEALGATVDIDSCSDEIQAATLLKNADEARYLIEELRDEDWIKIKPSAKSDSGLVVIRLKGYQRLEELERPKSHQNRS